MKKSSAAGLVLAGLLLLQGCDIARDVREAIGSEETAKMFEPSSIEPLFEQVPASLQNQVDAAKPMMQEMLGTVACIPPNDSQTKRIRLQRYTAPGAYPFDFSPPKESMRHNTDLCLTMTTIGSWKSSAGNNLQFIVNYLSRNSQETTMREFKLEQQPNGEWLVRW